MLTGMPHTFLSGAMQAEMGVTLPPLGQYGAGNVFFPRDPKAVAQCKAIVQKHIDRIGLRLISWRPIPVDNSALGPTSLESEPHHEMLLVGAGEGKTLPEGALDRELYRLRLVAANEIHAAGDALDLDVHLPVGADGDDDVALLRHGCLRRRCPTERAEGTQTKQRLGADSEGTLRGDRERARGLQLQVRTRTEAVVRFLNQ